MSVTRAGLLSINYGPDSSGAVPIGSILMWGGRYGDTPNGWKICNGDYLNKNDYENLYNIFTFGQSIVNPHGPDIGNTFKLPDLRNRFILGRSDIDRVGISSNEVGDTGGSSNVTLTLEQIPPHTHTVERQDAQNDAGDRPWPASNNDCIIRNVETGSSGGLNGVTQPHDNMPPYYVLTYIIRAK